MNKQDRECKTGKVMVLSDGEKRDIYEYNGIKYILEQDTPFSVTSWSRRVLVDIYTNKLVELLDGQKGRVVSSKGESEEARKNRGNPYAIFDKEIDVVLPNENAHNMIFVDDKEWTKVKTNKDLVKILDHGQETGKILDEWLAKLIGGPLPTTDFMQAKKYEGLSLKPETAKIMHIIFQYVSNRFPQWIHPSGMGKSVQTDFISRLEEYLGVKITTENYKQWRELFAAIDEDSINKTTINFRDNNIYTNKKTLTNKKDFSILNLNGFVDMLGCYIDIFIDPEYVPMKITINPSERDKTENRVKVLKPTWRDYGLLFE